MIWLKARFINTRTGSPDSRSGKAKRSYFVQLKSGGMDSTVMSFSEIAIETFVWICKFFNGRKVTE